jgi:hypothetical protein
VSRPPAVNTLRNHIDIDDTLLDTATTAGPFSSEQAAAEAGMRFVATHVAYRERLTLAGMLMRDGAREGALRLRMRSAGGAES